MSTILSAVTLRQFRSYEEASFEFNPGVNILIGPNAIGKTNLLEAVHVVCFGKGFRATSDAELIRKGDDWARIDADFGNATRVVKLEKKDAARLTKRFEIGGRSLHRLAYDDILPVVLFEPDALRLAAGGPDRRRTYIDVLLTKTVQGYRQDLLGYERVLKQRNTLLKKGARNSEQLFVWNIQLAERGAKIVAARRAIIQTISDQLSEVYSMVAGSSSSIQLSYSEKTDNDHYANLLMKQLEAVVERDYARGYTSVGPHRDDMSITLNGESMKETASRGENRTLLLALKIIELEMVEHAHHTKPLLLLDDVFSELDGSRRTLLTRFLSDHQTLITTTDADVVGKKFTQLAQIITLS